MLCTDNNVTDAPVMERNWRKCPVMLCYVMSSKIQVSQWLKLCQMTRVQWTTAHHQHIVGEKYRSQKQAGQLGKWRGKKEEGPRLIALRSTRMTYRWIRWGRSYANNLRPVIEIWWEPCKCSTRYAKASWEPREQDIVIYSIKGCTQIKWDE